MSFLITSEEPLPLSLVEQLIDEAKRVLPWNKPTGEVEGPFHATKDEGDR